MVAVPMGPVTGALHIPDARFLLLHHTVHLGCVAWEVTWQP